MYECLIGGVYVYDDVLNCGLFCGVVLIKKELFDGFIKVVVKYFNWFVSVGVNVNKWYGVVCGMEFIKV